MKKTTANVGEIDFPNSKNRNRKKIAVNKLIVNLKPTLLALIFFEFVS